MCSLPFKMFQCISQGGVSGACLNYLSHWPAFGSGFPMRVPSTIINKLLTDLRRKLSTILDLSFKMQGIYVKCKIPIRIYLFQDPRSPEIIFVTSHRKTVCLLIIFGMLEEGEAAQWIEHLLDKHWDLSLDPHHP